MPTAKRETLSAVHDDDLEALLTSLGIYGDFAGGRLRCSICGDAITANNLYAIYPDSGQIKLVCEKPECIQSFVAMRSQAP